MSESKALSDPLLLPQSSIRGDSDVLDQVSPAVAGKMLLVSKADASHPSLDVESSYGPDDMTCPQCKKPFSRLLTYRTLDGTMSDFPVEESVCLLKRATWIQEQLKASHAVSTAEKGKAVASSDAFYSADTSDPVTDWQDYSNFYDEYDDDEEVEDFYFSSAAGRARIVLGNRRWGENGYVASGRQQGRPVQRTASKAGQGSSTGKKGSASKQSAGSKDTGTPAQKTPASKTPQTPPSGNATPQPKPVLPAAGTGSSTRTVPTDLPARSDFPTAGPATAVSSATPIRSGAAAAAAVTPSTPIPIGGGRNNGSVSRRGSGSDVAGTSSEGAWGSANSGGGWSSYRQGKKKATAESGLMGKSPGSDAGAGSSKAGRRARRNAKKAAADAKADVYAY
ncbi:TPA: hypothetical protein ACH3X2_008299 [Trebouxia sp. C0005]